MLDWLSRKADSAQFMGTNMKRTARSQLKIALSPFLTIPSRTREAARNDSNAETGPCTAG